MTVDAPVTVGVINFDNANTYTIAGAAAVTLETSAGDAQINVLSGEHTISTPLTFVGGLAVDTADGSGVTVAPATGFSGLEGDLTKNGTGSLVLGARFLVAGQLNLNAGEVSVAPNVLVLEGGDVNVADGATLKASGTINRRVLGVAGSTLEAVGNMDVGDINQPDGYGFAGHLEVGPYAVGLKDLDRAEVYETHLGDAGGDGTLSSFNGIEIQPVDVWGTLETHEGWVTGHGTIHGDVRLGTEGTNFAAVAGDGPGEEIIFDGIVRGSGQLEWVIFTGLHIPGGSAGFTVLGRGVDFAPATSMEILGPLGFDTPDHGDDPARGYDQWFATFGSHLVGGELFINLENYLPERGVAYEIFKSYAPDGPETAGFYEGWFSAITMDAAWPSPEKWFWEFAYTDGRTGRGDAPDADHPFYTASLMSNPEPGTLVMLLSGGLGLLLLVWRRRRS